MGLVLPMRKPNSSRVLNTLLFPDPVSNYSLQHYYPEPLNSLYSYLYYKNYEIILVVLCIIATLWQKKGEKNQQLKCHVKTHLQLKNII